MNSVNWLPIRKLLVAGLTGLLLTVLTGFGLDLTGTVADVLGQYGSMNARQAIETFLDLAILWLAAYWTPDPRVSGSSHPQAP